VNSSVGSVIFADDPSHVGCTRLQTTTAAYMSPRNTSLYLVIDPADSGILTLGAPGAPIAFACAVAPSGDIFEASAALCIARQFEYTALFTCCVTLFSPQQINFDMGGLDLDFRGSTVDELRRLLESFSCDAR